MWKSGGQSPEMLLPDKENLSDSTKIEEKPVSMAIGFPHGNPPDHQQAPQQYEQFQQQQHPPLAPLRGGLTMFGFVSPLHHHHPPSHTHPSPGMVPLTPLNPSAPPQLQTNNNESSCYTGIMPLANLDLGNNNRHYQCNTPPRRGLFFGPRNSKVSPPSAPANILCTPLPPPSTLVPPPLRQQFHHSNYPYLHQQQPSRAAIHHFGHTDGPRMPWMVPALVVIHSLVFVTIMYDNDCSRNSPPLTKCVLKFLNRLSFQPLNENPLLGPSYKALLFMGALQSKLVTDHGQGWRLVTSIWLHAGLFHLLANMAGLISIGLYMERDFGWVKVATIYLTSGFGGSLLSALFMKNQISVGASGALMGLLGASASEILINWNIVNHRNKSLAALVLAIAVNLSFGLMPHVDNFAHVGGISSGMLLGFIFLMRPRFAWINQMTHDVDDGRNGIGNGSRTKHTKMQTVTWFVALTMLFVSYGTAMLALFRGYGLDARSNCKWCQYMSCVPSFLWQCHDAF